MKKDHICLDNNLFIDLFQENREQAHRLLASIQQLECSIHMHIAQLHELVHTLKHRESYMEPLTEEEDREAQELLDYLEELEYLLLKNPEYLKEKKLTIGRPGFSNKEEDLLARDAEEILAPIIQNTNSKEFSKEKTDAIIVAYAKRQCAILFSEDKNHIEEMVENIQKEELQTIRPLWARIEDRGFPKLHTWRNRKLPPPKQQKSPKERVMDTFEH